MALNAATLLMILDSTGQRPFRDKLTTDNLNLHNELLGKTRERVLAVQKKQEPILADRSRSDEGKSTAVAALATHSLADFKFLEVVASREAATVARLKTTMCTIPQPVGMTLEEAREIRAEYAALSAQEKDMTFLLMAEASSVMDADDPEAQARATEELFALLGKKGRSLISLDIKTRGLSERATRLFPALSAELAQAEILAEQVSGLRDHVCLWLNGLGADQAKVHALLGGPEPVLPPMQAALAKRQMQPV